MVIHLEYPFRIEQIKLIQFITVTSNNKPKSRSYTKFVININADDNYLDCKLFIWEIPMGNL